ncbi:MAG: ZIP family zinc transporter [Halieaceae bacterium]
MLDAFFWGMVSTSSLIVGGLIGCWFNVGKRTLGLVMAFGAGVLISAVAYELVFEAVTLAKMSGGPALGLFAGALTFFLADRVISNMGADKRKSIAAPAGAAAMVVPLVLGILLDGIPESLVIGLGILEGGTVSIAMLVAVFISNVPEAVAGTAAMRASGWSSAKVLLLWLGIAVFCALATVAGFGLFGGVPAFWLAVVQAFAAGAILTMLGNTMIPEAYENGGTLVGLVLVFGFAVAVMVTVLERAAT